MGESQGQRKAGRGSEVPSERGEQRSEGNGRYGRYGEGAEGKAPRGGGYLRRQCRERDKTATGGNREEEERSPHQSSRNPSGSYSHRRSTRAWRRMYTYAHRWQSRGGISVGL